MKIHVGVSNLEQPLQAREWVSNLGHKRLFADLESWASEKEGRGWGECYVFVETTLPRAAQTRSRRNQVDMLVCFSDRLALCELKANSVFPGTNKLGDWCVQVNGQIERLRGLLREGGYDEQALCHYLFFPNLGFDDLRKVSDGLDHPHSAHHIWPAGAKPELRGKSHLGRPLYLTEALDRKLTSRALSPLGGQPGVQEFIHDRIVKGGGRFRSFDNFAITRAYLQTISPEMPILHDEWYVPGLRSEDLAACLGKLAGGFVELVGDPGIGKSTLAKEVLETAGRDFYEIGIPKECRTTREVCQVISKSVCGESAEGIGEESLIQHLSSEPYTFWIRHYEEASAGPLENLLQKAEALRRKPVAAQASWIVESVRPLAGLEGHRHELGPLDNRSVSRILERLRPGGAFSDSEDVVLRAGGNAERARRLWQSKRAADAETSDEFKWFCRQLSPHELQLLALLCVAVSKSPLGISAVALTRWAGQVTGLPSSAVKLAADSLLRSLTYHKVAKVTRFDREVFGGLLDDLLPDGMTTTIINDVSPGLLNAVLGTIGGEKQKRWQEALQEVLLGDAHSNTLPHVTLGMCWGDLEPFFRSPFRFTTLSKTLAWVDKFGWGDDVSKRDRYLLKAMRILTRIETGNLIEAEGELGTPEGDDASDFAFKLVKGRTLLAAHIDNPQFNLRAWLREIERCRDSALQAELYVGTAMALQHSNRPARPREAWDILRDLWQRYEVGSTPRCLAAYQALAYLNRTKVRSGVVADDEAVSRISQLARELIEFGLKIENIQLLCDSLFYLVRSREYRKGRTSYPEVLGYRAALKFIEENQGRTVMRLQVLLTQGSVHRHYCRQDKLGWEEFRQHMEDGLGCYERALRSAATHRHTLHMLNATSYMMDFCVKSLRHAGNHEAGEVIAANSRKVLAHAGRVLEHAGAGPVRTEEANILSSIRRDIPLLLYVTAVADPGLDESLVGAVKTSFGGMVDIIIGDVTKAGEDDAYYEPGLKKNVDDALRRVGNTLDAGRKIEPWRNRYLLEALRPDILRLAAGTKCVTTAGRPLKPWQRLTEMLGDVLDLPLTT
jgi:hypothetical protein